MSTQVANQSEVTTRVRISKKLFSTMPKGVADSLKEMCENRGIVKIDIIINKVSVYVAEGCRYRGYNELGEEVSGFTVVSESTLGAGGLSHRIGARISLPKGCFLIEEQLFCGKWFISVYQF